MDALAVLAVLIAIAGVGFAVAALRGGPRATATEQRVAALDSLGRRGRRQADSDGVDLRLGSRIGGGRIIRRERLLLERAGIPISPVGFLLLHGVTALIAFLIAVSVVGQSGGALALSLLAAVAGLALPRIYVTSRAKKRAQQLEQQLIELLSMVATSVRAGFSLMQSLESVALRLGPPISDGIDRMIADIQLGRDTEEAMHDWVLFTGSRDVAIAVTAILVQRSSGGNLAEVLENLAQTMRDRIELRQQLSSLTAYPRMTSRVIAVYPFAIAGLLTLLGPETWAMLWTTSTGHMLLAVAIALDTMAFLALRRIARLDY